MHKAPSKQAQTILIIQDSGDKSRQRMFSIFFGGKWAGMKLGPIVSIPKA
jgi:hypothetical protein